MIYTDKIQGQLRWFGSACHMPKRLTKRVWDDSASEKEDQQQCGKAEYVKWKKRKYSSKTKHTLPLPDHT